MSYLSAGNSYKIRLSSKSSIYYLRKEGITRAAYIRQKLVLGGQVNVRSHSHCI